MLRGSVAFALAFVTTLFAFWQLDQRVQLNQLVEGVLIGFVGVGLYHAFKAGLRAAGL